MYLDHFWIGFCLPCQQVLGFLKPPALIFVDHCGGEQGEGVDMRPEGTRRSRPLCLPRAAHWYPGSHYPKCQVMLMLTSRPELPALSNLSPTFPTFTITPTSTK